MKDPNNKKIKLDSLFYLALILITFDIFPFQKYNLGSAKALSIIPLLLYAVLKLFEGHVRLQKTELNGLVLIILILGISVIHALHYGNYSGFSQAMNMFLVYIVTYYSYKCFIVRASREDVRRAFLCIYYSFTFSLFFGFIELVNFKFIHSEFINSMLEVFLRDGMYVAQGRLQFNFGEPSSTAIMFILTLLPTIMVLNKMNYSFGIAGKLKVSVLFLLSIFTVSITFAMQMVLYILLRTLFSEKIKSKKRIFLILGAILLVVIGYCILNSQQFQAFALNSSNRVLRVFASSDLFMADSSIQTRIGMVQLGIISFLKKPIWGYGWGYFKYAYNENYMSIDNAYKSVEYLSRYNADGLQSYSLYTTAMAEGGIVGIIWLILMLNKRLNNIRTWAIPFVIIFLIQLFQSVYIYQVPLVLMFLLITDKKINDLMSTNKDGLNNSTSSVLGIRNKTAFL